MDPENCLLENFYFPDPRFRYLVWLEFAYRYSYSAYKRSSDPTTVAKSRESLDEDNPMAVHEEFIPVDDYDQYKNDIDYFLPAFFK